LSALTTKFSAFLVHKKLKLPSRPEAGQAETYEVYPSTSLNILDINLIGLAHPDLSGC